MIPTTRERAKQIYECCFIAYEADDKDEEKSLVWISEILTTLVADVRRETLEEAAIHCDSRIVDWMDRIQQFKMEFEDPAKEIRALAERNK